MLTPFAYKPLAFAFKYRNQPEVFTRYNPLQYYNARQTGKTRRAMGAFDDWLELMQKEAEFKALYQPRVIIKDGELRMRFPVVSSRPIILAKPPVPPPVLSHYDEVAFFKE